MTPTVLVCAPRDNFAPHELPDGEVRRCSKCQRKIIVALSGVRLLNARPTIRALCYYCVPKNVTGFGITNPATVAAEMRAYRERIRRGKQPWDR